MEHVAFAWCFLFDSHTSMALEIVFQVTQYFWLPDKLGCMSSVQEQTSKQMKSGIIWFSSFLTFFTSVPRRRESQEVRKDLISSSFANWPRWLRFANARVWLDVELAILRHPVYALRELAEKVRQLWIFFQNLGTKSWFQPGNGLTQAIKRKKMLNKSSLFCTDRNSDWTNDYVAKTVNSIQGTEMTAFEQLNFLPFFQYL